MRAALPNVCVASRDFARWGTIAFAPVGGAAFGTLAAGLLSADGLWLRSGFARLLESFAAPFGADFFSLFGAFFFSPLGAAFFCWRRRFCRAARTSGSLYSLPDVSLPLSLCCPA